MRAAVSSRASRSDSAPPIIRPASGGWFRASSTSRTISPSRCSSNPVRITRGSVPNNPAAIHRSIHAPEKSTKWIRQVLWGSGTRLAEVSASTTSPASSRCRRRPATVSPTVPRTRKCSRQPAPAMAGSSSPEPTAVTYKPQASSWGVGRTFHRWEGGWDMRFPCGRAPSIVTEKSNLLTELQLSRCPGEPLSWGFPIDSNTGLFFRFPRRGGSASCRIPTQLTLKAMP